jgi:hypothetical protein
MVESKKYHQKVLLKNFPMNGHRFDNLNFVGQLYFSYYEYNTNGTLDGAKQIPMVSIGIARSIL